MSDPEATGPGATRRRYVPLIWRVAALNAGLLAAAVVVTLLVLDPHRLSRFALDEAVVLVAGLALVGLGNLLLLRRLVGPIAELTGLARSVDLTSPLVRMPHPDRASEAGELAATFNEMLDRLQAERREATGRVLAGQEAERLRIARELHDQIGQELTAVLLGLARARNTAPPEFSDQLGEVQEAVRANLESVRRIAVELRPEALDELGLVSALAVLGERFAERSGVTVTQEIDDPLPPLHPDRELVVYRVAQEALTNVARHSGAERARLTLHADDADPGGLVLQVTDAGRGLPTGGTPGTGMRGMRERAALVGGELTVGPGDGGDGCTVRLRIDRFATATAPATEAADAFDAAHHPDPAR